MLSPVPVSPSRSAHISRLLTPKRSRETFTPAPELSTERQSLLREHKRAVNSRKEVEALRNRIRLLQKEQEKIESNVQSIDLRREKTVQV